ncbi:hypothetical protein HMPREF0080_01477 [Anaeroglobus geminatus F0357]|uniref:Uncharacterized protein n=1 Tax=Anaeroglobus geminatus F0357 TaxID=861450 RepID=G9YII5_9FIRM|nr:hypothetical protein HMPREF0080_01477 [Anaeroglobus geminatus F0357]
MALNFCIPVTGGHDRSSGGSGVRRSFSYRCGRIFLPRTVREGISRVAASNFESCCLCW